METFEREFEPRRGPEEPPKKKSDVFFSWVFILGVVAALLYAAYWLKAHVL